MSNPKHLDVGYIPTDKPTFFLHVTVDFHDKKGYYCAVNAVELEVSDTGFACTKFGCFDGGLQTFKIEDAARFNAKRLSVLAATTKSDLVNKNASDALTASVVKSLEAKGLHLAEGPLRVLGRADAFNRVRPVPETEANVEAAFEGKSE